MQDIAKTLEKRAVFLKGHFVLDSFLHTDEYVDKANLYKDPILTDHVCWRMAQKIFLHFHREEPPEVVVGPATGGIVLSNRIARYLSDFYEARVVSLFTEKDEEGNQELKRGCLTDIPGRRILVVDDVVTTGLQVRQIIEEAQKNKGDVVGVGMLCHRPDSRYRKLNLPLIALLERRLKTWKEEECPLCKKRAPVNKWVGRGIEFLNSHPDYPG